MKMLIDMNCVSIRQAIEADIPGILELQAKNLYTNLSETDRENGFVTTPFTIEKIKIVLNQTGLFVAEMEGKIVGYVFAGSWDFFSQWPIFRFMVSRFPQLNFRGNSITTSNTFQYGPICIDQALRGSEIFPKLFETMRSGMASRYSMGVTFINKANHRSFAAHTRKLNLEVIDEFEFNESFYYGVGFLTNQ